MKRVLYEIDFIFAVLLQIAIERESSAFTILLIRWT